MSEIALGSQAGVAMPTGSDNIALGSQVGVAMPTAPLASQAKAGVMVSANINPDKEAENLRLAAAARFPAEVARLFPEEAKTEAALNAHNFDLLALEHPATSKVLANVDTAKLAHDDVGNMSSLESVFKTFIANPLRSAAAGISDINSSAWGWAQAGTKYIADLTDPVIGAILPQNPLQLAAQAFGERRKSTNAMNDRIAPDMANMGVAERGINSGFRMLGQMAIPTAATVATGNPMFGAEGIGALFGGQSVGKALDAGKTPLQALTYGAEDTIAAGAFNAIPMGKLVESLGQNRHYLAMVGHQMLAGLPAAVGATALMSFNEYANLHPEKPFSEYLSSLPEATRDTLIASIVPALVLPGVARLGSRGPISDVQKAQQAQQTGEALTQLGDLAEASKVRARSPETFQDFVKNATEDGPVSHVYVDAKELAQSGIVDKLAEVSPAVREQYQTALATGGDVAIPIAEYVTHIAGTENGKALLDHLKTDPEGMSTAQAKVFMENHAEDLKAEIERTTKVQEGDATFKASHDAVKDTVLAKLNEANRFTPNVNEQYATLIAARTANRAAKLGMTPEAFFAEHGGVDVQAEGLGGKTFNQETYYQAANEKIKQWTEGALPTGHNIDLGAPSQLLQQFGFPSDSKIHLGKAVLDKAVKKHGVEAEDLHGIAEAVHNPIAVFASKKGEGHRVLITELRHADGNIAVAVELSSVHSGTKVTDIRSLHPKGDGNVAEWVSAGHLLGYEKTKGVNYLSGILGPIPSANQGNNALTKARIYEREANGKRKELNQFAGAGAQTSNKWLLGAALDRLHSGDAAEAVRVETGWFRGQDGKMRFEISDANAQMRTTALSELKENGSKRLGDLLDHPALYAAYPFLKRMAVIASSAKDGAYGNYSSKNNAITLRVNRDAYDITSTLLHEIQHVIQEREGFARGANPEEFKSSGYSEEALRDAQILHVMQKGKPNLEPHEVEQYFKTQTSRDPARGAMGAFSNMSHDAVKAEIAKGSSFDQYWRTAGEVEARNVQRRQNHDYELISVDSPAETQDVPAHKVILHYNGSDMLSAATPENVHGQGEGKRGSFNPEKSVVTLFKNADLSTFLHETGHFFFENDIQLATKLLAKGELSAGEQSIVSDVSKMLEHNGIQGDIEHQLDQWHSMDFEEQRASHERMAESFEHYLFTGEAPSLAMQKVFQNFRAWLLNVYKSMSNFLAGHPEAGKLSDEVRGVFDRMLASNDQIKIAEQSRSMMPMFSEPKFGMSPEAFAEYHHLGVEQSNQAIQDLQTRTLRDMRYMDNARSKALKELQKEASAKRAVMQMEARREVMSQPVYRAWQFLTTKLGVHDKVEPLVMPKSHPDVLDTSQDSLFKAIAKLGGLKREEVSTQWGEDLTKQDSGVFGKPVVRKEGGLSIDMMAEALAREGYVSKDNAVHDLEAAFDSESRGNKKYSNAVDPAIFREEGKAGQQYDVEALGAGRFDSGSIRDMVLPEQDVAKLNAEKMIARDGIHPDLVADMFGFSSGDELVRKLVDATPPKETIDALTDQKMLENYADLSSPEAIQIAADKAIHNQVRAKMIATEYNVLAQATGKPKVLASAAKAFAEATIAKLAVRDISPNQYANAEARAARAARKAELAGDIELAASEKRNELLNNYLTKAAYDAREEVSKIVDYSKKFDSQSVRKNLDVSYLGAIDTMLDKFDFRQVSGKQIDRTNNLRNWVQARLNSGEIPLISESLLDKPRQKEYDAAVKSRDEDGNLLYADDEKRISLLADLIDKSATRSYKEATVEELRGLRDAVKQVEHLARLKNEMLTAKDKASFNAVRDELAEAIKANAKRSGQNLRTSNTTLGKLGEKYDAAKGFLTKAATVIHEFDGSTGAGPWWERVLRPANERQSWESSRRAKATGELMEILSPLLSKRSYKDVYGTGKFFPELGTSLNWQERMAVALNYGNESNLQRLMGGGIASNKVGAEGLKALNMGQVQTVLRSLSAEDWHAVQKIWNHFESYRPEIGEKELRVNGVAPEWITPRAFEITTSDGQTLHLEGGYFPVKFDPRVNAEAEKQAKSQEAKDAMKAAYSTATTNRSFTKSRVEEVQGRPLRLSLDTVTSGVGDIIHDLAWHEWAIDFNRLMRSNTIDSAIREHYGSETKKVLTEWRDDIIGGSKNLEASFDGVLGFIRKNVSMASIGWNAVSAIQQPLGALNAIPTIGGKAVANGIVKYFSNPFKAVDFAKTNSEFMQNRTRTMFRELNEVSNAIQTKNNPLDPIHKFSYYLTSHAQLVADTIVWHGAHDKALAEGHDAATASALGDQAVKDSQGGGEAVDMARIESRGGNGQKMFTQFYSYMNTMFNQMMIVKNVGDSTGAKWAHMALLAFIMPGLTDLLKAALKAEGLKDWDSPAKAALQLAHSGVTNALGLLPILREFSPMAEAVTGGKVPDYQGPTGLKMIPDSVAFFKQAKQGHADEAFRKALINLTGDFTGIPSVAINRAVTGVKAISEGKTKNPAAPVFGFNDAKH